MPTLPLWPTTPLVKFLLVAVIVGGAVWGVVAGIKAIDANGYGRAESKYKLQISIDDKLRADEVQRAKDAADQIRLQEAENINALSGALMASKSKIDVLTKRLNERATDVSTLYRPQPNAALQPLPGWTITRGWVCDYNRAIGYALPDASAAVSGNESASCTADPFSTSAVSAENVLRHHEDYGAYCRKLEDQVNALLDHAEFIERNKNK